ncbi:MAG: repressor LexA [Candidatus Moranbacteria bacterium]|nr:repressor LexA [Candidatus Moranbacteria bacterium]
MNIKKLTQKQKKIFEYICDCLEKDGVSPTILQLAKFMGVSSLRTVTQYLESLEKKKLIVRSRHQSRGIRLATHNDVMIQTVILPVVSSAGCDNMQVFAEQTFDEFITLDRDFIHGKNPQQVFVFRAVGDSMKDAGIETGDLVITEKTLEVANKDKVVAVVDGMALIKQINFSSNAVVLHPMSQDPQYRPIIMKKDFQVFGKVIDVIKDFSGGEELVYESLKSCYPS